MLTLWDLMPTRRVLAWVASRARASSRGKRVAAPSTAPARANAVRGATRASRASAPADGAAARYDALTRRMLETHGVRVKRWRKAMSGVAWEVRYRDGSTVRLIEAPRPKGPMSAAVFLHEIGHHAIGFSVYKPRCLEEYHAWAWAIRAMEESGVAVTDSVRYRMHQSLAYAVAKAKRRGLRELPAELAPFEHPLPSRRRRSGASRRSGG